MKRKRLFVFVLLVLVAGLIAATNFGALSLLGIRWAPGVGGGEVAVAKSDAVKVSSLTTEENSAEEFSHDSIEKLDTEIEALEQEIKARQTQIEREQVVKMLNENRINDYERQIYFKLLNTQADARTRQISLRLKRLRMIVDQGSES